MVNFDNEKALDVFADLIEPFTEILSDEGIKEAFKGNESKARIAKMAIKKHKKEVIQILAILDDVPVEEYKVNVFTLPAKVIEILNDPTFADLFTSQGQKKTEKSSGSAMESIEDGAK